LAHFVTVMSQLEEGNTKTSSRARSWCFTLNNYTDQEFKDLTSWLAQKHKYICGQEVGEGGTPHLQGYFIAKNALRFDSLKKAWPRVHWEMARGTRDQNVAYCSKEGKTISNFENGKLKLLKEYEGVVWRPWQSRILEILDTIPDRRTIFWVVDINGNKGKSFLCKYIALTRVVVIADGKKDNVFNQINNLVNVEEKEFNTVILDIPRHNLDYINYGVLEKIKDGLIYSGKYEGGICIFRNVHLIVFANDHPDRSTMSEDRWEIMELT